MEGGGGVWQGVALGSIFPRKIREDQEQSEKETLLNHRMLLWNGADKSVYKQNRTVWKQDSNSFLFIRAHVVSGHGLQASQAWAYAVVDRDIRSLSQKASSSYDTDRPVQKTEAPCIPCELLHGAVLRLACHAPTDKNFRRSLDLGSQHEAWCRSRFHCNFFITTTSSLDPAHSLLV